MLLDVGYGSAGLCLCVKPTTTILPGSPSSTQKLKRWFTRSSRTATRRNRDPSIAQRIRAQRPDELRLCSVVQAELYYGAHHSLHVTTNLALLARFLPLFLSLPFDDRTAEVYGRIRADPAAKGTPIGPND